MMVHAKLAALGQSRWYEYLLRFALGGVVTVVAGVIADHWGPEVGGLFLAFPAIFCASATLIEKHERQRKTRQGLKGERRGADAAALDASGAALGGIGMMAFALAVWLWAAELGPWVLPLAALIWLIVAVTAWRLQRLLPRLGSSGQ